MRERFRAKDERSWKLRFHTQTAGVSLTAQQPYNNVVRTALQALSAVLGGTNSLHTNSLDEALALPTAEAATLALRTQQIIAHESGVANVVDPLGGSYFVEKLTADLEREALAYFERDRRDGRHGRGHRAAASRSRRSPRARTASSRPSSAARRSSSASTTTSSRTSAPMPILYIDERRGGDAAGAAGSVDGESRRRTRLRERSRRCGAAAAGTENHDAADPRRRPRLRHARRDVRRAARRVGRVGGERRSI